MLQALKPSDIPDGYSVNDGVITNLIVALLGFALVAYLFFTQ